MIDEAIRLARLGLAVHFLRPPTGGEEKGRGKAPIRKHWQRKPAMTERQLRREYHPGCNLGLHCGAVEGASVQVVALDCDGLSAIEFLRSRGVLPTPIKTKTRKGFHLLYRHPGVFVPTRLKVDGHPLDVIGDSRAGGWNLVLPPSVHPCGFVYRAIGGKWTGEQLADMPTFDPAWIPEKPAAVPCVRSNLPPAWKLTERTLKCAEAALDKMHPAIQGQYGSRSTLIAALMLARRFQLDEDRIFDLLLRSYNPRCVPPWSERELRQKARDAVRIAEGRR